MLKGNTAHTADQIMQKVIIIKIMAITIIRCPDGPNGLEKALVYSVFMHFLSISSIVNAVSVAFF